MSANSNMVEFHLHPVENKAKSDAQGLPIFDDVEFIKIFSPGDHTSIVDKPATEEHRRTYATQYAAFKAGQEQLAEGMPLKEWPGVTRGQVETFHAMKVRTVEQLAEVSDTNLMRLGAGATSLRQKARDYLAKAKDAAPLTQMRAELEKRDAEMAEMKRLMAQMSEALQDRKEESKPEQAPQAQAEEPKHEEHHEHHAKRSHHAKK